MNNFKNLTETQRDSSELLYRERDKFQLEKN